MREAEIAALSDEFFEPEFDRNSAVAMLGSPVNTDELDERTVTYLRPDARTLARVEVYTGPGAVPDEGPFVDELLLVLRGARTYSRALLEELLGPARTLVGPANEDGEPSVQMEFEQARSLRGLVMMRWWPEPQDPDGMGTEHGPDEVRVDEVHLRRFLPGTEPGTSSHGAEGAWHTMPVPSTTPVPVIDLDEAMDTGVWLATLAWRVLRPDFSLAHALELFGSIAAPVPDAPGLLFIHPDDPRLQQVVVSVEDESVLAARLDAPGLSPLVVALDAVADRLNAVPVHEDDTLRFQFEATRSRGVVTLFLASNATADSPLLAIAAMEVVRG